MFESHPPTSSCEERFFRGDYGVIHAMLKLILNVLWSHIMTALDQ